MAKVTITIEDNGDDIVADADLGTPLVVDAASHTLAQEYGVLLINIIKACAEDEELEESLFDLFGNADTLSDDSPVYESPKEIADYLRKHPEDEG